MNNALKLGGIYGLISILIGIGYPMIMGTDAMFDWKFMIIGLVVGLVILIVLGQKMLRPTEGDNTLYYGEALKYLFVATFVGGLLSQVVTIARYDGNEEVKEAFEDYTESAQESGVRMGVKLAGGSDEDAEVEIEKMREKIESGEIPEPTYPFSWAGLPMAIFGTVISSLITSLIAAIFVKKT